MGEEKDATGYVKISHLALFNAKLFEGGEGDLAFDSGPETLSTKRSSGTRTKVPTL